MNHLKSLSFKIIAAIFMLVAVAFVADTFLTQSISNKVHERTIALTGDMRAIVEAKDNEINSLLTGLLASKEQAQSLDHSVTASKLTAESQRTESYLEGTRHGISLSVASLISAAMMSGDAVAALEQIDVLLENDQIAAINLWRADGELAFRDNKTIEAVNTFVDAEVFEPREAEPTVTLAKDRKAVLTQAIKQNSNHLSLDASLKDDDDKTIPVTYSYFILKNSEDCQSCHDPKEEVRGVVEVAVPSAELIALREKSQAMIAELDEQREAETAALVKANKTEADKVADQTARYSAELDSANTELMTTREEATLMSMAAKLIFFVLTMTLLVVTLGRLLTAPLQRLTSAMLRLSENDLTVETTDGDREDEIGAMSRAVSIFKDNALERQKLEQESRNHMLEQQKRQELIETLLNDFRARIQASLETVSTRAESMQNSATSLNNLSTSTSQQARSADEASSNSADNVQHMAAASTQLTSSIAEIGEQVIRTNDLVTAASNEAHETDVKVASLAEAAEKIGEVVSLIRDISEQTNLLALNATIEAARAGEAGRGFAVVAAEVKDLAAQTGKATEDIASRIQSIQGSTTSSVEAIRSIATKMTEISEYTTAISAAVQEQNASTNEISANIQQAADGTKEVVSNISGVAASTEKTRSAANEVESASQTVANVALEMRDVIDEFLDRVAAA